MKKVTRLYQQFQPTKYSLQIMPDSDKLKFTGTVTISGKKTGRPSNRITFHQKDLKITNARVIKHDKKNDESVTVVRINTHKSYDEVRLHTQEKVFAGDYTISLDFEGIITSNMNGIYPCFFKHNGINKKIIATQFESHHAREAFPCIDEPEAKATFDLTLITPLNNTVIANTPIKKQTINDSSQITTFETTPRMSTYLLAFAYGDLGYIEAKTKHGVQVRAYATPDNVDLTKHSVNVAVRALDFFTDYFGVPYPLKKLDMLALPDFSSGAMENWGLVTYRETAMLADEKSTSIESKQMIALVVAHELSHQWFGNLVTMKWWDDLWLNESFANLMEYQAVDAIYPEWKIWEQFVFSEGASAKRRDSIVDVQPIRTQVKHPDEISTLFDPSIVYAKGGTVLYMLKNYIGEKAFRTGLQLYFERHAYSNTVAADLWQALSETSEKNISDFMSGWLNRPGYPIVQVKWKPNTQCVELTQKRFLTNPDQAAQNNEPWQVPLAATRQLSSDLLSDKTDSFTLQDKTETAFLLNHDGTSYYLPLYSNTEHLNSILDAIKHNNISIIDKLLLIDNYNLLQRGGEVSTAELLKLITAYAEEDNESVWSSAAYGLAEARRLVEGDVSEDNLNKLIRGLVVPKAIKLGWHDTPEDTAHTLRLRGLMLSLASAAKDEKIIAEGLRLFKLANKPNELDPSSRSIVFFIAARYGDEYEFQKLLQMHNMTNNADEKDELASGLTSVTQKNQIDYLLSLLKTDEIRRQDLMHWWVWLLRNRYSRVAAWEWLTDNWSWIEHEFESDKSYGFFARYAGSLFSHRDELNKYKLFYEDKKSIVALARDITLGEQEIASRIAWRERNEDSVRDWLKSL